LLAQFSADKSSHAVRLPPGRSHGLYKQMRLSRTVRQQVSK
jgi:hypothetical protein